jgi:hypothetical protein
MEPSRPRFESACRLVVPEALPHTRLPPAQPG